MVLQVPKSWSACCLLPIDGFDSPFPRRMPGIPQQTELERHFHYMLKLSALSPTKAYRAHCEAFMSSFLGRHCSIMSLRYPYMRQLSLILA